MKFIMNWDQPQGPFRRAYTCHRPRHEGKDDKTSGNSRKRNSSTQACVENGCECMCVSGCLTCCRCPSAGCVCSCLVVAPAVAKDIVSRATLCPDLCADCGHCQESNWVSWPGCRQWTLSGEQLGVLAWVQTVDAVKRETSVSWPVCSLASDAVKILWTLSGEQLGALAWEKTGVSVEQLPTCINEAIFCIFCRTLSAEQLCVLACVQTVDTVRRATGCPGLGADSGCSQEGNFSVLACVQPGK
ncbi:uncharacterized protein LOC126999230 isoform X21 [Eriocheir sinensis]|uniref:uncharacterized protein LOC126999230 isoform X21 n=1 Tax=Eriocheir sinensis TaxID=95602 RepID=UPI0021C8DDEB|nr:uncharacterized protein LOC126999230 isoform X21 [Eriocheir sinensis]